jgi:ketosteroid isomerase-like protein
MKRGRFSPWRAGRPSLMPKCPGLASTRESYVSARKAVVATYFDGFRRSDHKQILACLTDAVAWDLPGYTHLAGKDAFDQEIENDEFVGSPTLTVDRLIEEADTVVATGNGETTHKSGELHRFAFCDVFTFAGDEISRVESYLVPLK